jgi:hypothetical protein
VPVSAWAASARPISLIQGLKAIDLFRLDDAAVSNAT